MKYKSFTNSYRNIKIQGLLKIYKARKIEWRAIFAKKKKKKLKRERNLDEPDTQLQISDLYLKTLTSFTNRRNASIRPAEYENHAQDPITLHSFTLSSVPFRYFPLLPYTCLLFYGRSNKLVVILYACICFQKVPTEVIVRVVE